MSDEYRYTYAASLKRCNEPIKWAYEQCFMIFIQLGRKKRVFIRKTSSCQKIFYIYAYIVFSFFFSFYSSIKTYKNKKKKRDEIDKKIAHFFHVNTSNDSVEPLSIALLSQCYWSKEAWKGKEYRRNGATRDVDGERWCYRQIGRKNQVMFPLWMNGMQITIIARSRKNSTIPRERKTNWN